MVEADITWGLCLLSDALLSDALLSDALCNAAECWQCVVQQGIQQCSNQEYRVWCSSVVIKSTGFGAAV